MDNNVQTNGPIDTHFTSQSKIQKKITTFKSSNTKIVY